MEVSEERLSKNRKWSQLQKAVKGHWNKASQQFRNDEKALESQLRRFHEERRKSLRMLNWRKCELEKRFADGAITRQKHDARIPGGSKSNIRDDDKINEHMKSHGGAMVVAKSNGHLNLDRPDYRRYALESSIRDSHQLLPGRKRISKGNIDQSTKNEIDSDVINGFDKGLAHKERVSHTDVRKVNSWEHIPSESDKGRFLPSITEKAQKSHLMFSRPRSYTVSERSNVYIPTKERKSSAHQMESTITDRRKAFEEISNLEEQFKKLQTCRYLRPGVGRKLQQ